MYVCMYGGREGGREGRREGGIGREHISGETANRSAIYQIKANEMPSKMQKKCFRFDK